MRGRGAQPPTTGRLCVAEIVSGHREARPHWRLAPLWPLFGIISLERARKAPVMVVLVAVVVFVVVYDWQGGEIYQSEKEYLRTSPTWPVLDRAELTLAGRQVA